MKKIFTLIFTICVVAIANAQNFRTIEKNFEIVRPVKMITDEKGKDYITKSNDIYVHLEQLAMEGRDNYVHFWLEIDGEPVNYHSVEGRILEMTYNNSVSYFVEDDYYEYCHIFYEPITETWNVDLRTKKDN